MDLNAPRSPRELFDYFRLYERGGGLRALVGKWSLADVTPHQVYYSVLGRLPEPPHTVNGPNYDAGLHYINALRGEEFRTNLVASILNAYPEKRRMIFVHIPKCAGSHLNTKLISAFATVNFRVMDKRWMSADALFEDLRILALKTKESDNVAPYGHLPLIWYLNHRLIRFGDFPFSVVRDPAQVILSQVNYIITRFVRDRELKSVDTQDWARLIDKTKLAAGLASGDFRELGLDILFSDRLAPLNLICRYLGKGDAKSAFELCASAAIELTDIEHYAEWLKSRLGLDVGEPVNVSNPYITMQDLGADGLARIRSLTEQDCILMEKVRGIISKPGRCSVRGTELLG